MGRSLASPGLAGQGCLTPEPTRLLLKTGGPGRHKAAKQTGHEALRGQRPS